MCSTFDGGASEPPRGAAPWLVDPGASRIILTPGRVAPWNGQVLLPEIARALLDNGWRDMVFVLVGEDRQHRRYAERGARARASAASN